MDDSETINIPAFKRKRSIAARARKKPSYRLSKTSTKKRTKTESVMKVVLTNVRLRRNIKSQKLEVKREKVNKYLKQKSPSYKTWGFFYN